MSKHVSKKRLRISFSNNNLDRPAQGRCGHLTGVGGGPGSLGGHQSGVRNWANSAMSRAPR